MIHVFDMDGTLVDNREAVVAAYSLAGVRMPAHAWGKPWREWLVEACGGEKEAIAAREEKERRYPGILRQLGRVTPIGEFARTLPNFTIMTGAGRPAIECVLSMLKYPWFRVTAHHSLSQSEKLARLKEASSRNLDGVYWDDDFYFSHTIRVVLPRTWSVCHVR